MPTATAEPELFELTVRRGGRRDRWLGALQRHHRGIILGTLVGALTGLVAGDVVPATYAASARLYVVPGDDPTAPHGTSFDVANATLPLVLASLRSQTVADVTVTRLRLDDAWGLSPRHARRRLDERLTVVADRKANLVTVGFEDRSPARARAVVAAVAEAATALSLELWGQRNREHRRKLEAELERSSARLDSAETSLRLFRERTHVVDLAAQVKATVENAAALERLRIDKTLELRFTRGFGDGGAVEVQKSRRERAALSGELERLVHGGAELMPLVPLDEVPQLEVEYARFKRAVDEQAARHQLLALKVGELVAAEARPGGLAEVIDPPVEPQLPAGPSVGKLCLGGAALGTLLATALVLVQARRRELVLDPSDGVE